MAHSVIIGMTLGVSQSPCTIRPLLGALSFHQFFEGFALGGCISQVKKHIPKESKTFDLFPFQSTFVDCMMCVSWTISILDQGTCSFTFWILSGLPIEHNNQTLKNQPTKYILVAGWVVDVLCRRVSITCLQQLWHVVLH